MGRGQVEGVGHGSTGVVASVSIAAIVCVLNRPPTVVATTASAASTGWIRPRGPGSATLRGGGSVDIGSPFSPCWPRKNGTGGNCRQESEVE